MKTKRSISIYRKIITLTLLFMIPVVSALIVYLYYMVRSYNIELIASGESALNVYMEETMERMEEAQNSVISLYEDNSAGYILQNSQDFFQKFRIVNDLVRLCRIYFMSNHDICGYVLLYDSYQSSRFSFRPGLKSGFERNMRDQLQADVSDPKVANHWSVVQYDSVPYLRYTLDRSGVALGVILSIPQQPKQLQSGGWQITYRVADVPVEGDMQITDKLSWYNTDDGSVIRNGMVICTGQIPNTDFQMLLFMERNRSFTGRRSILILVVLLLLFIVGGFLGYRRMYRDLVLPVHEMEQVIRSITEGITNAKMDTCTGIKEFDTLSENFNHMTEQIRQLRIESYEKTLREERTRLQYLRLQIKPHFFLNCLTSLHALAMQQKTDKLENQIITLSNYFRYLMQDDFRLHPLSEEIQFTKDAVEIRRDGYRGEILLQIRAEEEAQQKMVPALLLETFVENSVKYSDCGGDLKLLISASVMREGETDYLVLLLTDNGVGFPEEWILRINGRKTENTGRHIGLVNLICRLNILYGERYRIHAENCDGATVEIWIPLESGQTVEADTIKTKEQEES